MGYLRRSESSASYSATYRRPLALIAEEEQTKYDKARHQLFQQRMGTTVLICLALIGIYHLFSTAWTYPLNSFHGANTKQRDVNSAYPSHHSHDHEHPYDKPASLRRHPNQQYYLTKQERIDQAILELQQYQADKEARLSEYEQEVKAQLEDKLRQDQEQQKYKG